MGRGWKILIGGRRGAGRAARASTRFVVGGKTEAGRGDRARRQDPRPARRRGSGGRRRPARRRARSSSSTASPARSTGGTGCCPALERDHRVIAIDLLGHGGSEKPDSGYAIPNQAELVAQALDGSGCATPRSSATRSAAPSRSPWPSSRRELVDRVVIIDMPPDHDRRQTSAFIAEPRLRAGDRRGPLANQARLRGQDGLEVAFAPGFDVPDDFVEDVKRMTYTSYDDSPAGSDDYTEKSPLDERMRRTGKPLLVIMGAEEQIVDDPPQAPRRIRAPRCPARRPADRRRRPLAQRREAGPDRPSGARICQIAPGRRTIVARDDAERGAQPQRSSRQRLRTRFWGPHGYCGGSHATCSDPLYPEPNLAAPAIPLQFPMPSEASVPYEPMFDSKQTLTTRLADTVDLIIDFATLGEYGLEPVGRTRQGCADLPPAPRQAATSRIGPQPPSAVTELPLRVAQPATPRSGPEQAAARRSGSKRSGHGERRRVAALRKPLDGGRSAPLPGRRSPRLLEARTALKRTGGDLLSQGVAPQVPSALSGLTALFGMGRGVSHSLCATGNFARPTPRWSLKTAQGLRVK